MADSGDRSFDRGAHSADDRRMARLVVRSPLRARLRSFIVVSLLMLRLSVVIWGAVYLLTSTRRRRPIQHGATSSALASSSARMKPVACGRASEVEDPLARFLHRTAFSFLSAGASG